MDLLESTRLFAKGILKRLYWLAPTLYRAPFDFAERYFEMSYKPPQWLMWVLLIVGFMIAGVLTYHDLRKQCGKTQKPNQIGLREQLNLLIEGGQKLRILSTSQGNPPPTAMAKNWRVKVKEFLSRNFNARYDDKWEAHTMHGKPQMGFTGIATTKQINLWNKLTAGIEWLEEFQNEIQDINHS
jgi:hypothetical protein